MNPLIVHYSKNGFVHNKQCRKPQLIKAATSTSRAEQSCEGDIFSTDNRWRNLKCYFMNFCVAVIIIWIKINRK